MWVRAAGLFAFDENGIGLISRSMKRELLILRHAKSDWDTGARSDFDRPLSKRGRRDAPRVGRFLQQRGLVPDYIVSSPAERAKQTVLAVCGEMNIGEEQVNWDDRIYHASAGSLLNVLNDCPGHARRVLIAGHNPGLEILLQNLCNHEIPMPDDYKLMPTGAVAQLDILSDWKDLEGRLARLVSLTRPASLPD